MIIKTILTSLLSLVMSISLASYEQNIKGTTIVKSELPVTESENSDITKTIKRSTGMSVNKDGSFSITRLSRENISNMGTEGTWTIFVYMCGTDLESGNGLATMDLQEMLDATGSHDVKFVIQTGGTNTWANDIVDSTKNQRYIVQNKSIKLVNEESLKSMGDSQTLSSFLSWGIDNYASEKMGVVFWNHGGGSISGVCFDENKDKDSLSLTEIERAFTSVFPKMTDSFEFVGFDACLMGTLETANMLAPHAKYMYASEELEPGYGWDYAVIANYIGKNPSVDGAALGKVVVDSFYDSCAAVGSESEATLSCIDLSKIDELVNSFNTVAKNMYNSSEDMSVLSEMVKDINSAENYGGNNKAEGYTNMVDLGGILKNVSDNVDGTEEALVALKDCVVYMKNGSSKSGANGLSIYYPLSIQGSSELSTFKNICVSPYYMSFVDKIAYGSDTKGVLDDYTDDNWFGEDSDYWNDSYVEEENSDYWEYLDSDNSSYNFDEEQSAISLSQAPSLDDEGTYSGVISKDTIHFVESVLCTVFLDAGDGDTLIDLGVDDNVFVDYETGKIEDNFNGYWFALADGQPLAIYIVEQAEDYNIYTSPIVLNGEETNLRIRMNYNNGEDYTIKIIGAWDGIDEETGMAAKEIKKLKDGDIIEPMYYSYSISTEDEGIHYGNEYTFNDNPEIFMECLYVGDYYYSFEIDDIFGGSIYTDCALFTIDENGEIYFQ